jgi:hypothetical protein
MVKCERKKMFNEGNQIHNFMSSSGSGTVINYGSGSTSQKVTVPTVPKCSALNGVGEGGGGDLKKSDISSKSHTNGHLLEVVLANTVHYVGDFMEKFFWRLTLIHSQVLLFLGSC